VLFCRLVAFFQISDREWSRSIGDSVTCSSCADTAANRQRCITESGVNKIKCLAGFVSVIAKMDENRFHFVTRQRQLGGGGGHSFIGNRVENRSLFIWGRRTKILAVWEVRTVHSVFTRLLTCLRRNYLLKHVNYWRNGRMDKKSRKKTLAAFRWLNGKKRTGIWNRRTGLHSLEKSLGKRLWNSSPRLGNKWMNE
jgi:hypothetical protein